MPTKAYICSNCKRIIGCVKNGIERFCIIENCEKNKSGVCETVALLVVYQADDISRNYSLCGPCAFLKQTLQVVNH